MTTGSRLFAGLVAVLVFGTLAVAALAEPETARFTGTVPADGASLAAPPAEFEVVFDGRVRARAFHLVVSSAGGEQVPTEEPWVDGSRLVLPIAGLAAGQYTAAYHVLFGDGQQVAGSARFTVAGGAGAPVAGGAPDAHGGHGADDPLSLGLLLVDLVLALVLVGALVLRRWRGRA
ncbi:copper resistance CopC family protein [Actinoplanes sp. NPDC051861]|uniref:copper resistance CopC family protein n=1 Tax=Actinoplanes sp. NPDC051861 TaxID=3155170 RepID=UPI00344262BB